MNMMMISKFSMIKMIIFMMPAKRHGLIVKKMKMHAITNGYNAYKSWNTYKNKLKPVMKNMKNVRKLKIS